MIKAKFDRYACDKSTYALIDNNGFLFPEGWTVMDEGGSILSHFRVLCPVHAERWIKRSDNVLYVKLFEEAVYFVRKQFTHIENVKTDTLKKAAKKLLKEKGSPRKQLGYWHGVFRK